MSLYGTGKDILFDTDKRYIEATYLNSRATKQKGKNLPGIRSRSVHQESDIITHTHTQF